jgi:hypothetical protein
MPDWGRHPNPGFRHRRRSVILIALATFLSATAVEAEPWPPLPPPRPPTVSPAEGQTKIRPTEPPAQEDASRPASASAQANECLSRLKAAGFDVEAAEAPAATNQDCRIENPVTLRAVPIAGREKPLRIAAEPILACRFAESFGSWLGSLVAPAILGATNSELAVVHTGPGFQCRNRNRLASGKLSAHAEGLAIDIADFELANANRIPVKPDGNEQHTATVNAVRRAACGWFTTVLGPGSDASHADHLHLDLQMHGSSDRYRICQ